MVDNESLIYTKRTISRISLFIEFWGYVIVHVSRKE